MFYALCSIPSGPDSFRIFINPTTTKGLHMLSSIIGQMTVISAPVTGSNMAFWKVMRKEFGHEPYDCLDAPTGTLTGVIRNIGAPYQSCEWLYRARHMN